MIIFIVMSATGPEYYEPLYEQSKVNEHQYWALLNLNVTALNLIYGYSHHHR